MARNDDRNTKQNNETARIERWRWMLEQNVPIIGGWMHRRIASALIDSAVSGNWLAAQSLAVVFALHEKEDVRRMAGQTLQKINYTTGIDAVWNVWSERATPNWKISRLATTLCQPAFPRAAVELAAHGPDQRYHARRPRIWSPAWTGLQE